MKHLTFPETIPLNKMLIQIGVKTIERDGKKYLQYEGREIPRCSSHQIEEVLLRDFNIKITYN